MAEKKTPEESVADAADSVAALGRLRGQVAELGQEIRELKKRGITKGELTTKVEQLKELKAKLKKAEEDADDTKWKVDAEALETVLLTRMFVVPSFEMYNGVAGLYDFGPPGCALKENILNKWRQHFIMEENMLQIEATTMTPEAVLKSSGHVDLFTDKMVKDTNTGECFRADKLLEARIDELVETDSSITAKRKSELQIIRNQADGLTAEELHAHLTELGVMMPSTMGAKATPQPFGMPFDFNLMFRTHIGPSGSQVGFLRPETAQGIFMNFRRMLAYNGSRLPFAGAQIGLAFRNEIAPRNGLIRVREFTMAEIEHFVDPLDKSHPKFRLVADTQLQLFTAENQSTGSLLITRTIGEAVRDGLVANETLGYFMARTQLFLIAIGVNPKGLRFRQHLRTEMAHYACDCWDAEILMSSGWVECVGHADRSAYDLEAHAKVTGVPQVATRSLSEPRKVEYLKAKVNKGKIGKEYKKAGAPLIKALTDLAEDMPRALDFERRLAAGEKIPYTVDGTDFEITRDFVSYETHVKTMMVENFTPGVIEPSFGIGRIITAVLEHSFSIREGAEARRVLSFPPEVAPVKVSILPLDQRVTDPAILVLKRQLTQLNVSSTIDDSGASIGKRYSRLDEIGVPFGITVEHDSTATGTVTVRDRDTCAQIRVDLDSVPGLIKDLCDGNRTWADAMASFEVVTTGEDKAASAGAGGPTAAGAGGGASASSATSSSRVVVEGRDRRAGRFSRPAAPIA